MLAVMAHARALILLIVPNAEVVIIVKGLLAQNASHARMKTQFVQDVEVVISRLKGMTHADNARMTLTVILVELVITRMVNQTFALNVLRAMKTVGLVRSVMVTGTRTMTLAGNVLKAMRIVRLRDQASTSTMVSTGDAVLKHVLVVVLVSSILPMMKMFVISAMRSVLHALAMLILALSAMMVTMSMENMMRSTKEL